MYCVAGYVFRESRYEVLKPLWATALAKFGLTHFHMVDCAHGCEEYAGLSSETRIACQTELMDLLKLHAEFGVCATMDKKTEREFANAKLHGVGDIDAHVMCAYVALHRMAAWSRQLDADVSTHYFFERGASGEAAFDHLLRSLFSNSPLVSERMRYSGHSFVPKREAAGVQCADILAWQGAKDRKSQKEGRARRADFKSLLEVDTYAVHVDSAHASQLLRLMKRQERQRAEFDHASYAWAARLLPTGEFEIFAARQRPFGPPSAGCAA